MLIKFCGPFSSCIAPVQTWQRCPNNFQTQKKKCDKKKNEEKEKKY